MPILGPEGAARFQEALIFDTLSKVAPLGACATRYFFLAGAERWVHGRRRESRSRVLRNDFGAGPAFPGNRTRFRGFVLVRQRGKNLGERLERAFGLMLRDHTAALIIGIDSPLLPPRILRIAIRELILCDAVLGPCPDGGYYLIGLRRLRVGIFRDIRWGSAFAFHDTLQNLLGRDYSCSILPPFADLDRPRDFRQLATVLARSRAERHLAPACWNFLKEFKTSHTGSKAIHRGRE